MRNCTISPFFQKDKPFASEYLNLVFTQNHSCETDDTAASLPGSKMNWNGHAKAQVEVRTSVCAQTQIIHLIEKGRFFPSKASASLPFSNTFKLLFQEDRVAFYHKRFGGDAFV